MNRIPVWFDTDMGVDDAAALLVLNRLETVEVVGISAVAGNVELFHTYDNVRKVCRLIGSAVPVYKGADKPLPRHWFCNKIPIFYYPLPPRRRSSRWPRGTPCIRPPGRRRAGWRSWPWGR